MHKNALIVGGLTAGGLIFLLICGVLGARVGENIRQQRARDAFNASVEETKKKLQNDLEMQNILRAESKPHPQIEKLDKSLEDLKEWDRQNKALIEGMRKELNK